MRRRLGCRRGWTIPFLNLVTIEWTFREGGTEVEKEEEPEGETETDEVTGSTETCGEELEGEGQQRQNCSL